MTNESASVTEARRQAAEARSKFWSSFDELLDYGQHLQDRLAPGHLARDAWEAAKSKGADLTEDAVDAVRARPVAATGVVAAIALFLAREPLMDLAGKLVNGKGKKSKSGKKPKKTKKMETTRNE